MARREWALKIVGKQVFHDRRCGPIVNFPRAVKLVTVEHARAVRIVKAEMKRTELDQYYYDDKQKMAVLHALERVMIALQRGRGGKG